MRDDAAKIGLRQREWPSECLGTLRDLSFSIELLVHALAKQNLDGIARQTANQERLCRVLHEAAIGLARSGNRETKTEIEAMTRRVRAQNCLQAAVLRRARRTTDIFRMVLAHSEVTYQDMLFPRANHG